MKKNKQNFIFVASQFNVKVNRVKRNAKIILWKKNFYSNIKYLNESKFYDYNITKIFLEFNSNIKYYKHIVDLTENKDSNDISLHRFFWEINTKYFYLTINRNQNIFVKIGKNNDYLELPFCYLCFSLINIFENKAIKEMSFFINERENDWKLYPFFFFWDLKAHFNFKNLKLKGFKQEWINIYDKYLFRLEYKFCVYKLLDWYHFELKLDWGVILLFHDSELYTYKLGITNDCSSTVSKTSLIPADNKLILKLFEKVNYVFLEKNFISELDPKDINYLKKVHFIVNLKKFYEKLKNLC